MKKPWSYLKKPAPFIVMVANSNMPLVWVGGTRELSEEYFDSFRLIEVRIGIGPCFYDFLLCGGEPYAFWI